VIRMILDDVILDRFSLTTAFRARLNINIRHVLPPLSFVRKMDTPERTLSARSAIKRDLHGYPGQGKFGVTRKHVSVRG
jgi:hypothetical protein